MKSVYLTLSLGYQESGKFHLESRMKQTVDANVDMNISSGTARERQAWAYIIFPREALRVCSFNSKGQYQSL